MENLAINISLPVQGVQLVLRALGKQPYDDVNGIIQHIIKTTNDQIEVAQRTPTQDVVKAPPPELLDPIDPRN